MTRPAFVIFDLDGTLVDTREDIAAAVNAGLTACGLPTAEEAQITSFVGDGVGRLVDRTVRAVGGDVALAPQVVEHLMAFYRVHPVVHTRPYPGLEALLASWQGRDLAVASNKPTELCRAVLAILGLTGPFREVLGADWGGPKKPAPDVLVHLADRLGRGPSEGVMVGDSVGDLEAGRGAGMATVAALYGFRPRQELLAAGPDAAIDRLEELPAALHRLGRR